MTNSEWKWTTTANTTDVCSFIHIHVWHTCIFCVQKDVDSFLIFWSQISWWCISPLCCRVFLVKQHIKSFTCIYCWVLYVITFFCVAYLCYHIYHQCMYQQGKRTVERQQDVAINMKTTKTEGILMEIFLYFLCSSKKEYWMILLADLAQMSILLPSSTTGKYKEDTIINTKKCI